MEPEWIHKLPNAEIMQSAHDFNLDPYLVRAICWQESRGESWKPRFEPAWRYFFETQIMAGRLGISKETEEKLQAMSWGPLQVMGSVARERGYLDDLPKLCWPELGIRYGCAHLRYLADHFSIQQDEPALISAYNQGSPHKTSGGMFLNQKSYVDPVCGYLRDLRALQ